jgi:hypothetical protein
MGPQSSSKAAARSSFPHSQCTTSTQRCCALVAHGLQTGYYTFGSKVSSGQLLLHDLFDGNARLQSAAESAPISLSMPSALQMWYQKITLLPHPASPGSYIAFTRAYIQRSPDMFSVVMLASSDGVNLTQVAVLWQPQPGHTFYDPHVSVDNSVCPPRYVMSTECVGKSGWASLCLSSSSSPHLPETWYYPTVFVDTVSSPARESASTGVSLTDGTQHYLAWTQVYDGTRDDDPRSHTFSQSAVVKSFYGSSYFGTEASAGVQTMQVYSAQCFALVSQPHACAASPQDGVRAAAFLQRLLGLQQPVRSRWNCRSAVLYLGRIHS